MSHVLDRLKKAQTPNAEMESRMYQELMSDIKLRAQEQARKEVMVELEGARAEVERVRAERDAARLLHQTSEETSGTLRAKIKSLETDVSKGFKSVESGKQQLIDGTQVLKSEIANEREKVQKLQVQIASLEGKLSEKPKVQTKIVQSSQAIPSFKLEPIRGQDGKIMSATITPVTH